MLSRSGGRGLSIVVLALAGYLWFDAQQRGSQAPVPLIAFLALVGISGLFAGGKPKACPIPKRRPGATADTEPPTDLDVQADPKAP